MAAIIPARPCIPTAGWSWVPDANWPQAPAIYQIYPRSFCDSNGSGIGDLKGITSKLDHVARLGVDAIWLSPFYVSAWEDGGYDVIDHTAVDPMIGTEADFDALVARAHDLGLLVMIDQVLNHTSSSHPWFKAALDGDDDMAKRYLFRDPKPDGTPPNNWLSQFGLQGWEYSIKRRQYYFHQFLTSQPSLNLRNPAVKEAHAKQMAGWRARGVDGFRFDVVTSFLWDESLKDNPPASPEVAEKVSGSESSIYKMQDHVYDMLPGDGAAYCENLRKWAGDDAYLIGEVTTGNKSIEVAMAFAETGRLNASYTTDLPEGGGCPAVIAEMVKTADLQRLVGWLSSHDQPRHVKSGPNLAIAAQVQAAMMALLPGPWLVYQGEEWGLPQPTLSQEEVTDPLDLLYWPDGPGREGGRVPIPWTDEGPYFGFSDAASWLPMRWHDVLDGRREVEKTYVDLIALRKQLGWTTGEVLTCDARGAQMTLRVIADGVIYVGEFAMDGDAARDNDPSGAAEFAVKSDDGTWSACIYRTD